MIESNAQFFSALKSLIDAWCERRCLGALRSILQAYPMPSGLTDSWAELAIALENVRAFARSEVTESELQTVNEAILVAWRAVKRS
jgi:hypothetical protein